MNQWTWPREEPPGYLYTDKQIQRLIDRWKAIGVREREMDAAELRHEIHRCECLGDATPQCGSRGAEYQAARAEGMANLHALLNARSQKADAA